MSELEINARPIYDAHCPKHRNRMVQLANGWFDIAFWCEECQAPYQIRLVKMRRFDMEAVQEQLLSNTKPEK